VAIGLIDMKIARRKSNPFRIVGNDVFIELRPGFEAVIDIADWPLVSTKVWSLPYVKHAMYPSCANGKGGSITLHRFLMPEVRMIDHKDTDTLNNRRSNLRPCTATQNVGNCNPKKPGKTKGVFWHKRDQKWFAAIGVNWKRKWLGYFKSKEEAAAAYAKAAVEHFGEFARTQERSS
jgi:hypothetical protein